jgi:hypothetical protein
VRQVVGGTALNIHPLAVKDVKEIGQRYLAISEELYDRFWEELDSALEMIDSLRNIITSIGPGNVAAI